MFVHWTYLQTPLGTLKIAGNGIALSEIGFEEMTLSKKEFQVPDYIAFAQEQIEEYFDFNRKEFQLHIDLSFGTSFQQEVWKYILAIPYGKTVSYSKIADDLGDRKMIRAVGQAVGANKLALVVPCHRVVSAEGEMTGFAWGIDRKRRLLEIEKADLYGLQDTLF